MPSGPAARAACELAAIGVGQERAESTSHERRALDAEQARPGQVRLADRPVATEREVADRREVVEVRVPLEQALDLAARALKLLVLELELDLVNLELVQEPQRIVRRAGRRLCLLAKTLLCDAPKLAGQGCVALIPLHVASRSPIARAS